MKIRLKPLLAALALPLGAGALGALGLRDSMEAFSALRKPPLTPPGWVFPVVWTVLYLMMGFASYLVYMSDAPHENVRTALIVYGISLAVNALWPTLFFGLGLYLIAFIDLVVLWFLVRSVMLQFYALRPLAAHLVFPYLLWLTFAGYLNIGVYLLNRA